MTRKKFPIKWHNFFRGPPMPWDTTSWERACMLSVSWNFKIWWFQWSVFWWIGKLKIVRYTTMVSCTDNLRIHPEDVDIDGTWGKNSWAVFIAVLAQFRAGLSFSSIFMQFFRRARHSKSVFTMFQVVLVVYFLSLLYSPAWIPQ